MDALRGSRGDDKIPRRLEDPRGTEGLPESDIEFASWRPAPRQPRHDHSVSHPPIIRPNAGLSDRNRAPILPGPRITHFSSKVQGVPVTLPRLR